jgi:hypothetical protein
MHTSTFGTIVLFAYVPLAIIIYSRMPLDRAVALCLMAAVCFLPSELEFDPPLIPPLNKRTIPLVVTGLAVAFSREKSTIERKSFFLLGVTLLTVFAIMGTVLSNRDSIRLAPTLVGQGLALGDIISIFWMQGLGLLVPFAVGRKVFGNPEGAMVLLRTWSVFGVIYGFLMLVEIRLSPILNYWVYGYFPGSFAQAVRNSGYRPTVFMNHGLATTMFCLTAIFAVLVMHRTREKIFEIEAKWWVAFLSVVLLLSNSLGVLIYLVAFLPLLLLGRIKLVILEARILLLLVLLMPLLRAAQLLPLDDLIEWIASYDTERAGSLAFRFNNETLLLERWAERPWFGFGGFGRERIYSPSGEDLTVIDSDWIYTLCYMGVFGFVSTYLLLLEPLRRARKVLVRLPHSKEQKILFILFVMLTFGVFDLMVNSISNYLLVLTAGTIFGLTEWIQTQQANVQRPGMALGPTGGRGR